MAFVLKNIANNYIIIALLNLFLSINIFLNTNTILPLTDLLINNTPKQDTLQLAVGGDVLLDSWISSNIKRHGGSSIFADFKRMFDISDVTMVNLECPISLKGIKETDKQYTFRANPEHTKILKDANIDVVSLANNHILDFGVLALQDTFSNLSRNSIAYVGAGMNEKDAIKPILIEKNGFKLAILASSRVIPKASWRAEKNRPGVATTYDPTRLKEEIKEASKKADGVLVYVHWGKEDLQEPLEYQRKLAQLYIDAGADIVLGSHPHVLQGFEYYKGKLIAYSLGNFIFTNAKRETMLMSITIDKDKNIKAKVIPCIIKYSKTSLIKESSKRKDMFRLLTKLSFGAEVDEKGNVLIANKK